MTNPIKIQAKHHRATKAVTVIRQGQPEKPISLMKKAPAPPPNPALVNPQNDPSPEVQQLQLIQEPKQNDPLPEAKQLQTSQEPKKSYDKHTDGALTYFNYYFEEIATPSTRANYPEPSTRSKIPVKAVGAGVVAATIASGLMIGEALNHSEAPQSNPSQDSAVKQNANSQNPRPTTTTPEKLETGRSLSSSPTGSTPSKSPANQQQTTPALKRTQSTANSLITSDSPISTSQPLKLPPLTLSPTRSTPTTPKAPNQPDNAGGSPTLLKDLPRPEIIRQVANPSAVAPPESLPPSGSFPEMAGSATPTLANSNNSTAAENGGTQVVSPSSSQFSAPTANSETTPFPPGSTMSTGAVPSSPTPSQSPYTPVSSQEGAAVSASNSVPPSEITAPSPNSTVNAADSLNRQTTPGPSANAPGDRLLETSNTALNRFTPAPMARSTAPSTTPEQSPLASNTSESIQDYLNRPPKPTAEAPALMPLSSKAAGEAATKPQIGAFKVRQVSQQDYQKEWQTSNRNPNDPAIAYAFPAYGFIDYQRQVIVVLKEQSDLNPLQSQKITTPNS